MVPFPSLGKLLAHDLMIQVAIMRHGFIYISSIGTTNGTIKRTTTGTSAIRSDLRVLDLELKKTSHQRSYERLLALVMSAQALALPGSCDYICSASRSDLMSSDVLARLPQVRQISVPSTLVSPICHVRFFLKKKYMFHLCIIHLSPLHLPSVTSPHPSVASHHPSFTCVSHMSCSTTITCIMSAFFFKKKLNK